MIDAPGKGNHKAFVDAAVERWRYYRDQRLDIVRESLEHWDLYLTKTREFRAKGEEWRANMGLPDAYANIEAKVANTVSIMLSADPVVQPEGVHDMFREDAQAVEKLLDSRGFPTAASLLRKLFEGKAGPDYPVEGDPMPVDWVAGMFMAFLSEAYRTAGGFDERFFLYYEDVDICRRLRARGLSTVFHPGVAVIHDARRASRHDPRLMAIHAASALRYLTRRYR